MSRGRGNEVDANSGYEGLTAFQSKPFWGPRRLSPRNAVVVSTVCYYGRFSQGCHDTASLAALYAEKEMNVPGDNWLFAVLSVEV